MSEIPHEEQLDDGRYDWPRKTIEFTNENLDLIWQLVSRHEHKLGQDYRAAVTVGDEAQRESIREDLQATHELMLVLNPDDPQLQDDS